MLPPELLSYPPSFPLTADLATVARQLAQAPYPGGEYLVVVDQYNAPLGAIALAPLWAFYHQCHLNSLPQSPPQGPQLLACQPWLQPVVMIPASSNLTDLWDYLQANPQGPWVLVDGAGCYQGAIQAAELLLWVTAAMPAMGSSSALGSRVPVPAQAHTWLMVLNHSVKTPLTSLLGLSTLLLDPRIGSLGDRQSRYVHLMRRAIRQLIRLINQWVDWIDLESDQFALTLARVDTSTLAETLLSQFHSTWLDDQGPTPAWIAEFSCDLNTNLPPLQADRRCLQQSLYGVLDYLLQAQSQPQALTIEPWGCWLGLTLSGSYPGGDGPDLARSAIPPMEPLDSLPLALARRLCQRQGGDLVGFCSPRYGYRLTLLLPATPTPVRPPATVLIGLISHSQAVIDQVYSLLQSSCYRLVVVGGEPTQLSNLQRLSAAAILYHGESLPPPDQLMANHGTDPTKPTPALIWIGPAPMGAGPEVATLLALADLDQRLVPTLVELSLTKPGYPPAQPQQRIFLLLNALPQIDPWQQALQYHNCQLLRAEDLTQASLLCRVWQPDAILLAQAFVAADWQSLLLLPELSQSLLVCICPPLEPPPASLSLMDVSAVMGQSPEAIATTLLQRIPWRPRQ